MSGLEWTPVHHEVAYASSMAPLISAADASSKTPAKRSRAEPLSPRGRVCSNVSKYASNWRCRSSGSASTRRMISLFRSMVTFPYSAYLLPLGRVCVESSKRIRPSPCARASSGRIVIACEPVDVPPPRIRPFRRRTALRCLQGAAGREVRDLAWSPEASRAAANPESRLPNHDRDAVSPRITDQNATQLFSSSRTNDSQRR